MAESKGKMITFPIDGGTAPGYLALPDATSSSGPYPGVVVLQEWWGLVPHIKEVAERFAGAGFVALAPDLYHGKTADEPDEARKLVMAHDRERAVAEIDAAARALQKMDVVAPGKVGVVGWCMGGGLALSAGADSEAIGAVVAYYGHPLSEEDTSRIKAPVLGLYGSEDHGIPVSQVEAFADALRKAGVEHEIHIYPGAKHAFFNDRRAAYDAEAATDAWRRTLAWFAKQLPAAGTSA